MTLTQVWGALLIFLVCPLLGGLPLIAWITYALTGRKLSNLGTGNISVSAAFYHGGRFVGILAVLSEAAKGIIAVLLARAFFPADEVWELFSLIALVMGRYWLGKGAGTTNVVWGIIVHDPIAAALIFVIGGISLTIIREKKAGRLAILVLLALILSLRHPQEPEIGVTAIALSLLIAWIYSKIPDDLDLPATDSQVTSQTMFRFFRGDKAVISLNSKLNPAKVGEKAANLAQLKNWGYPVPEGWVIPPGDDATPLIELLQPSRENPLVVRSSAVGEDGESASAAGQYLSILNITNQESLKSAIIDCLASYNRPHARQYRQDKQQKDEAMAILVQKQVRGVFSGVAFSRNPVNQLDDCVLIEALPGNTVQIVSGRVTPETYRVYLQAENHAQVEGRGDVPQALIKEVALLIREIEHLDHGIPQDLEWSYDGQQLWLLQIRPITTLQPIWTRKIAAEVIPGVIKPLTWSINQPLTCGVWGELFTLVLGKRSRGLNFQETATLHYHRAYFNASLLGEIFLRMGLPPESLEFLTRGTKFTKPPLKSTLINLPGLWKLVKKELSLKKDFARDYKKSFAPVLHKIEAQPASQLSPEELLTRAEDLLLLLRKATYYSILAPLSLALRQAIFKVADADLDNSQTPEVKSMRSLAQLAQKTGKLLPIAQLKDYNCAAFFAHLSEIPDGQNVLEQLNEWFKKYGYLGETATDIAIQRWQENPSPIRELFTQFLLNEAQNTASNSEIKASNWQIKLVQSRLNLKGKVTEIYSKLLAQLRWTFVALGEKWQESGIIEETEAIFFLKLTEIEQLIRDYNTQLTAEFPQLLQQRQFEWQRNQELTNLPYVIYGEPPLTLVPTKSPLSPRQRLQGIGASAGIVEGKVKILLSLEDIGEINQENILVVPYTDSGWAPLLTRVKGIIAEVGGRLSHGAIIAREYGIPAVMDVHNVTHLLHNGQRVRIDGQKGLVEILDG